MVGSGADVTGGCSSGVAGGVTAGRSTSGDGRLIVAGGVGEETAGRAVTGVAAAGRGTGGTALGSADFWGRATSITGRWLVGSIVTKIVSCGA